MEYIKAAAQQKLEELATDSYDERRLRYCQGAYKALKKVYEDYPDRLLEEIRRAIDM